MTELFLKILKEAVLTHPSVMFTQIFFPPNTGSTNTTASNDTGSGGGSGSSSTPPTKTSLSLTDTRTTFKRVAQTSSSSTLSGGTVVSVKQEGATVDNLVPSYVDSTTFINSPGVQQGSTVRQQGLVQQRNGAGGGGDDCESVALPSKFLQNNL